MQFEPVRVQTMSRITHFAKSSFLRNSNDVIMSTLETRHSTRLCDISIKCNPDQMKTTWDTTEINFLNTQYITILLVPILPVTTLLVTILPVTILPSDHITCDYFTLWPNYCRPNYCDHITVDQITAHPEDTLMLWSEVIFLNKSIVCVTLQKNQFRPLYISENNNFSSMVFCHYPWSLVSSFTYDVLCNIDSCWGTSGHLWHELVTFTSSPTYDRVIDFGPCDCDVNWLCELHY